MRPHDPQKDRVMKRRSREGFAAFAFRRGFGVTVLRRFCPELRFKIQLVHRLNKATDVVAQHLAKCFVDLRRLSPATKRSPDPGRVMRWRR